jgi:hypothetical protein
VTAGPGIDLGHRKFVNPPSREHHTQKIESHPQNYDKYPAPAPLTYEVYLVDEIFEIELTPLALKLDKWKRIYT